MKRIAGLAVSALLFTTVTAWPNPMPDSSRQLGSSRAVVDGWDIPEYLKLSDLYGAPPNDFSCKSDRNPVVLLHGLSANCEIDLNMLQKHLNERGYCTFSQTYGAHRLAPWVGGLAAMADSAKDIAAFVREVHEMTGARKKVDLVGHSEGGVMAVYVPMTQGGVSDIIEHTVALGPAIHGARYFGFTDLWYVGGRVTRNIASAVVKALGCAACDDMATGGAAYNEFLEAEKIVQDGNKATVIMSRSDKLVAPDASRIDEEGVRNVFVQDTCPDDKVGHAGLMWDRSVWGLVINALEETYDRSFELDEIYQSLVVQDENWPQCAEYMVAFPCGSTLGYTPPGGDDSGTFYEPGNLPRNGTATTPNIAGSITRPVSGATYTWTYNSIPRTVTVVSADAKPTATGEAGGDAADSEGQNQSQDRGQSEDQNEAGGNGDNEDGKNGSPSLMTPGFFLVGGPLLLLAIMML
ncbi:hypothetical protein DL764_009942 [Monosporascus ibericus]|uniref:AB hydrolase-1 domain-containing protein n=1 Tax=Monosporascus ibericus TaxID=155417 RepID=A0A4Q4STR5_9PEZI|nr:hypothetical protein DL764_009942 [Monosporascus ibericus]